MTLEDQITITTDNNTVKSSRRKRSSSNGRNSNRNMKETKNSQDKDSTYKNHSGLHYT